MSSTAVVDAIRAAAAQRVAIAPGGFELACYLFLAFALTWVVWLAAVWDPPGSAREAQNAIGPGLYGPSLAAVVVALLLGGRRRLGELLRPLLYWRVHVGWYLLVLTLPFALALPGLLLRLAIGEPVPGFADAAIYRDDMLPPGFAELSLWMIIVPLFVMVAIGAPLGEEIGWRGYLLPRLQSLMRPFSAGLLLGVIWGVWHLPLFWIAHMPHADTSLALFFVNMVGGSVIFTYIYNASGGSLLLAILFHAAHNTASGTMPINPHVDPAAAVATWTIALGLAALWRQAQPGPHVR